MLEVVTMEEAAGIIDEAFASLRTAAEDIDLMQACGRSVAADVVAPQGMPPFNRSTIDGYAVQAADTFGCSEALPALLTLAGNIAMGEPACQPCKSGECWAIPTGGAVPDGADAVVMVEHAEAFGDGTVGILSPVAPAANLVFKHDDAAPGDALCRQGEVLQAHHIGALASLGITHVPVLRPARVGIVSTGDEIVPMQAEPAGAQMRDVNGPLLAAAVAACGAHPTLLGIVPDDEHALAHVVAEACRTCDLVLVSGGSSVGQRDTTATVFGQLGTILLHGIAMKPGKPTLVANIDGTPAFGLPGHPLAAYFVFLEFVRPAIWSLQGEGPQAARTQPAILAQAIPSNHGRAECVAVSLELPQGNTAAVEDASSRTPANNEGRAACLEDGIANAQPSEALPTATPIRSKSGLIGLLSQAAGYVVVPRNQEGLPAGARVLVKPF